MKPARRAIEACSNVTPAAECRLESAASAHFDVTEHEALEEYVQAVADFGGNADVRPAVHLRGAVIGVEKSTPKPATRNAVDFPLPGGPATMNILGGTGSSGERRSARWKLPPKSRPASSRISTGRSLRIRFPLWSAIPSLFSSAAASRTRSPAADKCGPVRGTRDVCVSTGSIFVIIFDKLPHCRNAAIAILEGKWKYIWRRIRRPN